MRVAVFSSKDCDRRFLSSTRTGDLELNFLEHRLAEQTAGLAQGHAAVCVSVEDEVSAGVLTRLAEEENDLFFEDRSERGAFDDDLFARLLTFPNVLVTGHQGFFTADALTRIGEVTIANLLGFERGDGPQFPVTAGG
nr:hypothetical protein [Frankia tisae]